MSILSKLKPHTWNGLKKIQDSKAKDGSGRVVNRTHRSHADMSIASVQGDLFRENEYQTNKKACRGLMLYAILILLVNGLLSMEIHMFAMYTLVTVFMCTALFSAATAIFGKCMHYSPWWLRYVLISAMLLCTLMGFFMFSIYAFVFLLLPILMCIRYYDVKLTIWVGVLTWLGYLGCMGLNWWLDGTSSVFYDLHTYQGITIFRYAVDIFISEIIPKTMALGIVTYMCAETSRNGLKLVVKQAEDQSAMSRLDAEFDMASRIQMQALPKQHWSFDIDGEAAVNIGAVMVSAKEVAGDFYDYFMADENTVVFLVADVSDKGLAAAMFMMKAKMSVRMAFKNSHSLKDAVMNTNTILNENNQQFMFVTMWIACVDVRSGVGKFINAGHLPPVIKRSNGDVEWLTSDPEVFLGVYDGIEYQDHPFECGKGDAILLYTDGVTDALNMSEEEFGVGRVFDYMRKAPLINENLHDNLLDEIKSFVGEKERFDDMTALTFFYTGQSDVSGGEMTIAAEESEVTSVVDAVNELLDQKECPEDVRSLIDVAIDEIVSNVALYAYEGEAIETGAELETELATEPAPELATEPAPEVATEPAIDSATETVAGSATANATESATDSVTETVAESATANAAEVATANAALSVGLTDAEKIVEVAYEVGSNYIHIAISDYGKRFDPTAASAPDVESELQIGGYGIYFVKNIMDEVRYEYLKTAIGASIGASTGASTSTSTSASTGAPAGEGLDNLPANARGKNVLHMTKVWNC